MNRLLLIAFTILFAGGLAACDAAKSLPYIGGAATKIQTESLKALEPVGCLPEGQYTGALDFDGGGYTDDQKAAIEAMRDAFCPSRAPAS